MNGDTTSDYTCSASTDEMLPNQQKKVSKWLKQHDFGEYTERFISYGFDDLLVLSMLDEIQRKVRTERRFRLEVVNWDCANVPDKFSMFSRLQIL